MMEVGAAEPGLHRSTKQWPETKGRTCEGQSQLSSRQEGEKVISTNVCNWIFAAFVGSLSQCIPSPQFPFQKFSLNQGSLS
jgi:hypothetical protein